MDLSLLTRVLRASTFAKHTDFFVGCARPCVDLAITAEPAPLHGSRFGGAPVLPQGMQWPGSQQETAGPQSHGPYRFVAQIDCSELPDVGAGLPTAGMLSFFVGIDSDDGKFFWRSPGYVQAFLFAPGTPLVEVQPPEAVSFGTSRAIRFHAGVDLPFDRYSVQDWPWSDDYALLDAYRKVRASLHVSPHYLLGYPSHNSLGYDPRPGAGWQSLLTLDSDDELAWQWHDGDKLLVFIEAARLQQLDFASLASDAG